METSKAETALVHLLRLSLEECLRKTAADCATKMIEYENSEPLIDTTTGQVYQLHAGDPFIAAAIATLREESLQVVNTGFQRLLNAAVSQGYSGDQLASRTADQTWSAVDEAYGWQEGRQRASQFRQWFRKARALDDRNAPREVDVPLMFDVCANPDYPIDVRLNCDFRHMFQARISALSLGAALDGQSSSNSTREQTVPSITTRPWYDNATLRSRDPRISGPARGKLVEDILREIQQYAAVLNKLSSQHRNLCAEYSDSIVMDVYNRATAPRRYDFDNCIDNKRYSLLACELAADVARLSAATMKKAFQDYRKAKDNRG